MILIVIAAMWLVSVIACSCMVLLGCKNSHGRKNAAEQPKECFSQRDIELQKEFYRDYANIINYHGDNQFDERGKN